MITAIFKIKTSLKNAAQESLDTFGQGGRPEFTREEEAFSLCNTPVQNGYVRVIVAPHIAQALEYMRGKKMTGGHADLVRIEWHGQDVVETGVDEEGNPTYEQQLFQVGEEDVLDENNKVIGKRPVYLGRIA